ncbi:MAG: hypothetical protein HLX51_11855 [Micrococcaceae bacterium]|nr:hypothetical protein [Micrococcaceae bacterium]
MSNHPYPQHVVDAVQKQMDWSGSTAQVALQALWDASRIDSVEDAQKLPDGTKLINDKGIFVAEAVRRYHFYAEEFPAHVIYWGDSHE